MIICLDFDGVLAENTKIFSHGKIGKPIRPMVNFVKDRHSKGDTLLLMTTRLNKHPFADVKNSIDYGVVDGYAEYHLNKWLVQHDIKDCFTHIGCDKKFADVYIDDKALRYVRNKETSLVSTIKEMIKK